MPRKSCHSPVPVLAMLTLPWFAACEQSAPTAAAPEASVATTASSVTETPTGPTAGLLNPGASRERPFLVLHHGGLHAILTVLQEVTDPVTPRLADAEHNVVVAEAHAVPGTFAALLGTKLQLLSDAGESCTAEVVGFDYRAEIIPDGVLLDGLESEPTSPTDRAFWLWDAATEKQLAARLRPSGAACKGAPLVAYPMDGKALAAVERPLTPAQRNAAVSAFRTLTAYKTHQAAYEQEVLRDPEGLWPARWEDDGHELALQAFALPGGDTLVSVSAPYVGCRGFDLSLWATFRVDAHGRHALIETATEIPVYGVYGVMILNGGRFDFVVDEGLGTRSLVRGGERTASAGAEFHGCPC